jgi:putative ABC transport system ATP-binding protein
LAIIEITNLTKTYMAGEVAVPVLKGISFNIEKGEFVSIMGPSGSGKSTLMNILGCLDRPTSGKYKLNGQDVSKLGDNRSAYIRNKEIGFVFQSFNLLPRATALKNVLLPELYAGSRASASKAKQLLESVGLAHRIHHTPLQLSGGEQQRVAIARSLVNDPPIILGDEPTGNLDTATGNEIMDIFKDLNARGKTVIIVTHEPDIAKHTKRILRFRDGLLESDEGVS